MTQLTVQLMVLLVEQLRMCTADGTADGTACGAANGRANGKADCTAKGTGRRKVGGIQLVAQLMIANDTADGIHLME
jgi:hypothetical protein